MTTNRFILNLNGIYTREALHNTLAACLSLPDYYGRNLDALLDCLTDMRTDCVIEIFHLSDLMDNLMEYAERFLNVLHIASFENHHLTLVFSEEDPDGE